jgi:outer membrane protein assembly factor BamB
MRREHAWLLAGGLSVLACAVGVAAFVGARQAPAPDARGCVAVVLVPALTGSRLIAVDLESGRVVRTVTLRSLAMDIAADPASGLVVGAQTGGIGAEADDSLSFTDARSGSVTYLKLPAVDPSQVEIAAGRVLVMHAVWESGGFVTCAVDTRSRTVLRQGHAPVVTGLWSAAAGSVWTTTATSGPVPFALVRVDPSTLATSPGPDLDFVPFGVAEAGGTVLVLGGTGAPGAMTARVARLDATSSTVVSSAAVEGLPHGAQSAVSVGRLLVVCDWNGESPETGALAVLDRATLQRVGTLSLVERPCALAADGERLLVVDRAAGTLVCADPVTGKVAWKTDLGARNLVCSKVVVVSAAVR